MNPVARLRQAFDSDTHGFIYVKQLEQLSRSNHLIQEIAHQYGYFPVYERDSHHPTGYKHHTLITDTKELR